MDPVGHPRRRVGRHLRAGLRGNGGRARALARRTGVVAALFAAGEATGRIDSTAVGRERPVVVAFPGPGWDFASPRSHITFIGAEPAELGTVTVEGSVSGPHPGTLRAVRRGAGAIFEPSQDFEPGERVRVRTEMAIRGAGGREFSFGVARIARPPFLRPDLTAAVLLGSGRESTVLQACRPRRPRLRTLPHLRPAGWCVARRPTGRTAPGHIFVTPRSRPERRSYDQHGVMMLSSAGKLLWYSPRPYVARDLKTVMYRGARMLAFYEQSPEGRSSYVLMDRRYREVARIRPRYGFRTDTHELQLTRRGTAYISSYQPVAHPGLGRLVTDYVIQEIDLRTRDVLFEWHSLDHVPPAASYQVPPDAPYSWDYFHGNSIQPPNRRGTIIVSARNTSAVYGIDRTTGRLLWTLGGKRDEFGLGRRRQFCAQHDARPGPGGRMTIFDNGGPALGNMRDCPLHRARVLSFKLDLRARRAHLVRTIGSSPSSDDGSGFYVWAMGSTRRQPNDNLLIDWGTTGRVTEVAPGGDVVYGLQLAYYSYRAVRSPWRGRPIEPPVAVATRSGRGSVRVWASWNGATDVRRWRVLAGSSAGRLRRVGSARFAGLETRIAVRTRVGLVAVEALGGDGTALARSRVVRVR